MSVFKISRYNVLRHYRHSNIIGNFSDDASDKGKHKPKSDSTTPSDESKKDGDNQKKVSSTKLNELLAMMNTDTNFNIVKNIVHPKSAAEKKQSQLLKNADQEELDESKSETENIMTAARNVAKTLGGDEKKTESELLAILLKSNKNNSDRNLSSIIGEMKVDVNKDTASERRSDFVRKSLSKGKKSDEKQFVAGYVRPKRTQQDINHGKSVGGSVDLFGGNPLGIFTNVNDLKESPDILLTWKKLNQRELKLAVTHPPKNYFDKMAMWTEQGKLWKFPIDNEQGMDDEAKIYFSEHIFLDKHLESWCPNKGPIRHFMKLVCVGLSKNPYYTVAQKKEHIEWFRDYFAEKKELLEAVIIDAISPKELEKEK